MTPEQIEARLQQILIMHRVHSIEVQTAFRHLLRDVQEQVPNWREVQRLRSENERLRRALDRSAV